MAIAKVGLPALDKLDMKVTNKLVAFASGVAIMAALSVSAIPVTGVIAFEGSATVTSSGVTSWSGTEVAGVTGFGGLVHAGDAVSMAAPWSFNSGNVSGLWNVDGFVFDLTSSSIVFEGLGAVLVTGVGTITGNGYDATYGTWSFYSKVPKRSGTITTPIFSFTVTGGPVSPTTTSTTPSTAVPDGGTTLILLGVAFSVVAVLRRVLRKSIA